MITQSHVHVIMCILVRLEVRGHCICCSVHVCEQSVGRVGSEQSMKKDLLKHVFHVPQSATRFVLAGAAKPAGALPRAAAARVLLEGHVAASQ